MSRALAIHGGSTHSEPAGGYNAVWTAHLARCRARRGMSPHRDRQRLFSRGGETGLPAPFASFAPSHVRLRCVETGHFVDFRARLFRPRAANAVMSEQIEECGVSVTSWRDRHRAKFLHPRNTGQPGNARSFARVPVHSRRYAQLLASVGLCGGVCGVRPGVGQSTIESLLNAV